MLPGECRELFCPHDAPRLSGQQVPSSLADQEVSLGFFVLFWVLFFFLLYLLITATGFTSKTSSMCLGYMCFICSSEQGNCGTVGVVVVIVIIIIIIMIKKYICLGESYLFMFIFTLKDR